MAKLILVANSSKVGYRRGRDANGHPLIHQPGANYYELADEPLKDGEREAAAAIPGFRGVAVKRELVAVFNRPVTPLTADVVEKELVIAKKSTPEPKMFAIGDRDLTEEQKAVFDGWNALEYAALQKIGGEHDVQVVSVKKVDIIFSLMDKDVRLPE